MHRFNRRFRATASAAALVALAALTYSTGTPAHAAEPSADLPVVSIGDTWIGEGDSGPNRKLQLPVTLSNPATTEVDVTVALGFGSAVPDEDYVGWGGKHRVVKFKPNSKTGLTPTIKYVTIQVIPDEISGEPAADSISVYLIGAVGATIGEAEAHGFIVDADTGNEPLNGITTGDMTIEEGDAGTRKAKIPILLDDPATEPVSVEVHLEDFNLFAGTDYLPISPTGTRVLTFKPGQVQKFLSVTVSPNDELDPDSLGSTRVRATTSSPGFFAWFEGYLRVLDDESVTYLSAPRDVAPIIGGSCTYTGPGGPLPGSLVGFSWSAPVEGDPDNAYAGFATTFMPKHVLPKLTTVPLGAVPGFMHSFTPLCRPSGSVIEMWVWASSNSTGPPAGVTVTVP